MPLFWSILLAAFVAYCIVGLTLYFMQPRFLFHPVKEIEYTPADIELAYEEHFFVAEDGVELCGWYVPADRAGVTVLFCHGNGGNISHRLDTIKILNALGVNCFVFDYRGYGKSAGEPGEEGMYQDAQAAWEFLTTCKKTTPSDMIILGRSLGGPIAAHLAARVQARGLLLESTFTSYLDIGRKLYPYMPVRLFASYQYNTIEFVRGVQCPVLIIHSRYDELVPFEFGLQLYDAANEPKEFVEISGSHDNGFIFSEVDYQQAWSQWLDYLHRKNQ